jgi:hypothetical protein
MTLESTGGQEQILAATTGDKSEELSVHLQEYQMLTSRNTQWLAVQNNVWLLLAAFVALLLQLVNKLPLSTLLWLSFLALEVAVAAYSGIGRESYNNVFYMESTLRPRIQALTHNRGILRYESFVQRNRPSPQWIFDYGPPAVLTIILVLALYFYSSDLPQRSRGVWLTLMISLLAANWLWAHQAASARRRIPVDFGDAPPNSAAPADQKAPLPSR